MGELVGDRLLHYLGQEDLLDPVRAYRYYEHGYDIYKYYEHVRRTGYDINKDYQHVRQDMDMIYEKIINMLAGHGYDMRVREKKRENKVTRSGATTIVFTFNCF